MQFLEKSYPASFLLSLTECLGCLVFALTNLSLPLFELPSRPEIKLNEKYYVGTVINDHRSVCREACYSTASFKEIELKVKRAQLLRITFTHIDYSDVSQRT